MRCHLVWPVFNKTWGQWKIMLLWTPREPKYCCTSRNETGWNGNQPIGHLHTVLNIPFIKYICSEHEWLITFTEAKGEHSSQLSSPLTVTLSPQMRVYITVQCETPTALKPHKSVLFSLQSLCLFYQAFGYRKEKAQQLPIVNIWLRNNGTPCVILTAPRTPDVLLAANPLFLLFVRS